MNLSFREGVLALFTLPQPCVTIIFKYHETVYLGISRGMYQGDRTWKNLINPTKSKYFTGSVSLREIF